MESPYYNSTPEMMEARERAGVKAWKECMARVIPCDWCEGFGVVRAPQFTGRFSMPCLWCIGSGRKQMDEDKRQVNEEFLCDCEKDRKMEEGI